MSLGHRIRQIRLERNETQTEFAEKADVSVATVSRWETSVDKPHPKRYKKIAVLGNMTVDELLHGQPNETTTALAIMDYYIEYYTKLEDIDTARKLNEIRVDMDNAEEFGNDKRIRGI